MSSGFYLPPEMESTLEYNPGFGDNNGDPADQQPNSSLKQTNMSSPQSFHNAKELNTHSRLDSKDTDDSSQERKNLSQDMRVIKYAPNMGPVEAQGYSTRQRRNSFQDMTGFGHANKAKLPGLDMVSIIAFWPWWRTDSGDFRTHAQSQVQKNSGSSSNILTG
jgi:hypothetical protein